MSFASEYDTSTVLDSNNGEKILGYHTEYIQKGVLGTPSKISEEYFEFMDACKQDNPLMQLIELSDLLGAIDAFAKQYNMSVKSLLVMTEATKRAFESGSRK